MEIKRIWELPDDVRALASAARCEGHLHLDRLISDFSDGTNKFLLVGEALFGCFDAEALVGVGGINRDPYTSALNAGRVRRVYIHPRIRRNGVGQRLMVTIENHAVRYFSHLQLYTQSDCAGAFYEALGYDHIKSAEKVSHAKALSNDA